MKSSLIIPKLFYFYYDFLQHKIQDTYHAQAKSKILSILNPNPARLNTNLPYH